MHGPVWPHLLWAAHIVPKILEYQVRENFSKEISQISRCGASQADNVKEYGVYEDRGETENYFARFDREYWWSFRFFPR